jgi:glycoprotein 2-beta-D-xylosyltransferase
MGVPNALPESTSSTPVRLRVGATNNRRHYPLGWLLALLSGAGTLAMIMSLLTVEDGLWQASTQLMAATDNATATASDPARARWIAAMRAINKVVTTAPVGAASTPTASPVASESQVAFLLSPDVRVPPKFASEGDTVVSDEFQCFSKRDYGVIVRLANSTRLFCAETVTSDNGEEMVTSSFAHLSVGDADLMATAFRHLRLDLRNAQVAHDISAVSEDGGGHDPRIRYTPNLTECSCAQTQDRAHGVPRVWRFFLAADPEDNYVACSSRPMTAAQWTSGRDSGENPLVVAGRNTVVLSRKDDHNPFFQLSALFNAWIAVRAASWSTDSMQLLFLDKGLPTPMDELQHALLAPNVPAIRGGDVLGRVVHLESALVAPIETSGPLMTHLNDRQPCQHNQLLTEFRRAAIHSMGIDEAANSTNSTEKCVVTVISRRAYGGRRVQRMWTNEDEVLDKMRADYGDLCVVQSFDFADLPMQEQMRLMLTSDVVIGMHGAGMVNVAWTRPGTLVVEIFPKRRFRWGYRNLCQFLGCDWHEFRKGRDVMVGRDTDPNAMDKTIDYSVWKAFFEPLLRSRLANMAKTYLSSSMGPRL